RTFQMQMQLGLGKSNDKRTETWGRTHVSDFIAKTADYAEKNSLLRSRAHSVVNSSRTHCDAGCRKSRCPVQSPAIRKTEARSESGAHSSTARSRTHCARAQGSHQEREPRGGG